MQRVAFAPRGTSVSLLSRLPRPARRFRVDERASVAIEMDTPGCTEINQIHMRP